MTLKTYLTRLPSALLPIAILLISIAPLSNSKVEAAGESYRWKDQQSITVTGGSLKQSATLVKSNNYGLPGPERFNGSFLVDADPDCDISLYVEISNNTSGKIVVYRGDTIGAPGSTPQCLYNQESILNSYDNNPVSIGGTRPSDSSTTAETAQQRTVTIRVRSPDPLQSSPDTITITVKDSAGAVVKSESVNKGEASLNDAEYYMILQLDPGAYVVCASKFIECQNFTKEKFRLLDLRYGESYTSKQIKVAVEFKQISAVETIHIDSQTLSLQKPDGTEIKTAITDARDIEPTNSQEQSGGAVQIDTTATVSALFNDISPGRYKICLKSTTKCQNVTKEANKQAEVKLELTYAESTQYIGANVDAPAQPTCESTGASLGWITCPIINGIADGANFIYEKLVYPLLITKSIEINGNKPIFRTWSSFRVLANVLLILFLLIIIFSQTIGGGMIDAYSVRKIMPRLLIAAVLINLSIYIVALAVDVTNVIGKGLANLIFIPFNASGTFEFGVGTFTSALSIGGLTAGVWALVGTAGAVMNYVMLFILLPALMAFIGAFLTLFIRQGLIVFLILVSPVAFALYCLPNTEQYFRKWWGLLLKTLLVYPIVMAIFAIATVMPAVFEMTGRDDLLTELMQIVSLFLPLFLIPFAFKFAGGAITTLYGAISGRGKQLSEAIKGNPNNPDSLRNRTMRNLGIQARVAGLTPAQVGSLLNPRQITRDGRLRGQAQRRILRQVGLQQYRGEVEKTGLWQTVQGDSNIMRELSHYESPEQAIGAAANWRGLELDHIQTNLSNGVITAEEAQTQRDDLERRYGQRMTAIAGAERVGYNPATRRAAFLNPYQIGFEMEAGEAGWQEALHIMDNIADGDDFQLRSMMDEFQAIAKSPGVGRVDLAANTDGDRAYNGLRAWESGSLYEIGNGKPRAIAGSGEYFRGLVGRIRDNNLNETEHAAFQEEATRRGVSIRTVATEAVGAFYKEQITLGNSAKGAARTEAVRQRDLMAPVIEASIPKEVLVEMSGPMFSRDGRPLSTLERIDVDPNVNTKARTYDTPERISQQQAGG